MAKPLSMDLRERIVAARCSGGTLRAVAARFAVAPSAVSKICKRHRETGSVAPRPMGGDRRSHVIEAKGGCILALLSAEPDLTLSDLRARLGAQGLVVGYGGLWRFLDRHDISVKKNPACERARPA